MRFASGIHFQDLDFDHLPYVKHLGDPFHALVIKFADVDQALDARLKLDERAEGSVRVTLPVTFDPLGILVRCQGPGIRGQLPHSQADLLTVLVDGENLDLDLLAFLQPFRRVARRRHFIWPMCKKP